MATHEEYQRVKKIARELEQKLANTPSDTKEFDKLGYALIQTQRQLKDIVIALGPSMSTLQDDDVVMTVTTTPPTSVSTKRKPQKKQQKTLTDSFFNTNTLKKPRITDPNATKEDDINQQTFTSNKNKQIATSKKDNPTTTPRTKQNKPTSDEAKTTLTPTKQSTSSSSLAHATNANTQSKPTTTTNTESTPVMNYKATASKAIKHNKHTHRLNLSVPGFQKQGDTRQNGVHSVLKALAFQLNVVDSTARILPWQSTYDTSHPALGHGTVSHITSNQSNDYIRSRTRQGYVQGRTHYRQGVRITTKFNLDVFTNLWNQARREVDNMYGITTAESQHHHQYALVGICSGSSQKKDTTLLMEKLREMTNLHTLDGSWQSIMVGDLTKSLWDEASKRAEDEVRAASRQRINAKSRKFDWAPTGLAIYAPTEAEAKKVRAILVPKYSKNVAAGVFPQWPDGSRM